MTWMFIPSPSCPSAWDWGDWSGLSSWLAFHRGLSLGWKGKPTPPLSWRRAWNREGWTRHLSGMTLPSSTADRSRSAPISVWLPARGQVSEYSSERPRKVLVPTAFTALETPLSMWQPGGSVSSHAPEADTDWPPRLVVSHVDVPLRAHGVSVVRAELECGHRVGGIRLPAIGSQVGCWVCSRAGVVEVTAEVVDPVGGCA